MNKENLVKRIKYNDFFKKTIIVISFCLIIPLFFILFYILKNGLSVINWEFLTALPEVLDMDAEKVTGGIFNAITGTSILILLAVLIAVPIGILSAIYINENKKTKLASRVRLAVEVLNGIPSIVVGIVAYQWVVVPLGSYSAFSGGVALGIMMLPIIVRSTEETLKLIPYSLKEAALALGVPKYKTILKVILPAGFSGIFTGILLAVARIAGETAPLLFTAFGNPFMNLNIARPMNSLPVLIYNYASSPYEIWHKVAWGASVVLVIFVLGLNILAKVVTRKWKVQF
jgi:phosphate transport system permease protein